MKGRNGYQYRKVWRLDNAYNDFKNNPFKNNFLPYDNYPIEVKEGNIYIDRGINSAFERHLKLQEIRTMEALNNYGNNWFKIINNG